MTVRLPINQIICGDNVSVLKDWPDNSISAVVTDPPYGIKFMSSRWDYDIPPVETWSELLRVMKPGAHALVACGTRTQHKMATNLEDAGFEIRDIVVWACGSRFPKGHNTTLKPVIELFTLARKHLAEKTVTKNVRLWGCGEMNIDKCRIPLVPRVDDSQIRTMNRGVRREDDGWGFNNKTGDNPVVVRSEGRYPSNLIHDGSDEVLSLFPNTKSGLMKQHINGRKAHIYGKQYPRDVETIGDSGSAARFFYCAKASPSEKGKYNNHIAVKPLALMRYLCRLITPPDGIVLDPFAGSGSTLVAAKLEGLNYIGIEISEEYHRIAKERINNI